MQKVKIVQDDSRHWYIIPNELYQDFHRDLDNEYMVDTGEFDKKYHKYMTNGGMNEIQLYAEI
jgi:hypothetical protein